MSWAKKIGILAMGLLLAVLPASAQAFYPAYGKAYALAFKLKIDSARLLLGAQVPGQEQEAQRLLILSLADMIENMVRETPSPTQNYLNAQDNRITTLAGMSKPGPWARHALSECYLHKALFQGLFVGRISASLSFSKAYFSNKSLRERSPAFGPALKSAALYNIVIGQVPEYGGWLASMFGFSGNVDTGTAQLQRASLTPVAQQGEAILLYSLVLLYQQHEPEKGLALLKKYASHEPDNFLGLTFLASAYKENHQNEKALATIRLARADKTHIPYYYPQLLKGELFLQNLELDSAIVNLEAYVAVCNPKRLKKHALYRLFTAYHLRGDSALANQSFYAIGADGEMGGDGDRYALYFFTHGEIPDKRLLQARLLSDGGYNARAQAVLDSIIPSSLHTLTELTELQYRRARLAQRRKDTASADRLFKLTISTAQSLPTYYAPMACLQLGEAALTKKNWKQAEDWFDKAKTYPKHEYKNALDDRADMDKRRLKRARKAAEGKK